MIEHFLKFVGITVAFLEIAGGLAIFGLVILSKFYD
jgi:hypothetical protein